MSSGSSITPWLFNIAMENGPFVDGKNLGLPIKNGGSFHGKLLVITRWCDASGVARGYQAQIDERAAEYGGSPIYGLAGRA